MNDSSSSAAILRKDVPRPVQLIWTVLPLFLFGVAAAWLFMGDPLRVFDNGAPPIKKLTFERRVRRERLSSQGARRWLRADDDRPGTGR